MAEKAASSCPVGSAGRFRGEGSWKGALLGRPIWVSPVPSPEEVRELSRRFPEVAEVPAAGLRERTASWEATALVGRSLGRWVSPELVAREFRLRGAVKGEVTAHGLEAGVFLVRFGDAADRDSVLRRPWTAAGQVLALEAWRPGFFPDEGAITSAAVWVRLPRLPAEYWEAEAIGELLRLAGDTLFLDECTVEQRRMGFARACVRIDLGRPLRPGVLVKGPAGPFWQRFVYESLDGVCLACGCFHPPVATCRQGKGETMEGPGSDDSPRAAAMTENPRSVAGPPLGPWLLAVRRREVRQPRGEAGRGREAGTATSNLGAEAPRGKAAERIDGWSQPAKVARRRSPGPEEGEVWRGVGSWSTAKNVFGPLAELSEAGGPAQRKEGKRVLEEGKPKRARPMVSSAGRALVKGSSKKGDVVGAKGVDSLKHKGMGSASLPAEGAVSSRGTEIFTFAAQDLMEAEVGPSVPGGSGPSGEGASFHVEDTGPVCMEQEISHEAAVDRIRLAISAERSAPGLEDAMDGIVMVDSQSGGGSSPGPSSGEPSL